MRKDEVKLTSSRYLREVVRDFDDWVSAMKCLNLGFRRFRRSVNVHLTNQRSLKCAGPDLGLIVH